MERLRHFCAATILTFTFTLVAFAGDMQCGVTSESPSQQTSITGDMATGATVTVDPITGLALDILQSLLSLF
jgi:hypothetical protein